VGKLAESGDPEFNAHGTDQRSNMDLAIWNLQGPLVVVRWYVFGMLVILRQRLVWISPGKKVPLLNKY